MQDNSYLIFGLNGDRYGIRRDCVKEIFALPELASPSTTSPGSHSIIGIAEFRGTSLPIIDLNLNLGNSTLDYRLSDVVIVLKGLEVQVGIIVNEVYDMQTISSEKLVAQSPDLQERVNAGKPTIVKFFSIEDEICILHDPESWIDTQQISNLLQHTPDQSSTHEDAVHSVPDANAQFSQSTTAVEQEIFRRRANNLKEFTQKPDLGTLRPIAVVTLGDRFWGIDLDMIREFADIQKVTPIPCCPAYIVGNTNLRSEILTLIDIRSFLNLPQPELINDFKVMIVEVEDIIAAVLIEEVNDALFMLNPQDITTAMPEPYASCEQSLAGLAPYSEGMMGILDFSKLLSKNHLVVDQTL